MNRRLQKKTTRKLLTFLAGLVIFVHYQCSHPQIQEPLQESGAIEKSSDFLEGRAVKISDGDTVTLLDSENQTHRIRLLGIDSPERSQPFGKQATESLKELIQNRPIRIEIHDRDRYGRILGKLQIENRDLNLEQIKRGFAWHYRHFAKNQPTLDRTSYAEAERVAREKKLGLWIDPNPEAPWDFRKKKKSR